MKTVLTGMWWVRGNEHGKFSGRLTCANGYEPSLETYLMDHDMQVPENSIIYGEVFEESKQVKAVTLLRCSAQHGRGSLEVQPFIYKQQHIRVDCVAIGMFLEDGEIAQLQSPQDVYLTCPGLDEYSAAHAIEYVWKDNIPKGRAYRSNDLKNIVYTQPEPIAIEIDTATITISVGPSSTARDITSRYRIHINLEKPTPEAEVNSLIYEQFWTFLSLMTGRREYISKHSVTVHSDRTRPESLGIELSYGYAADSPHDTEYSLLQTLLMGNEGNLKKFVTLFPKWRENFTFVERLVFHYIQMVEQSTEASLLQAFPLIEEYVLERLLKKHKKGMPGILSDVINSIADHFSYSKVYGQHFPTDRREHIADQLANFRHKRIHPRSTKKCVYSSTEVYTYIAVIARSIFLREMEYPVENIDGAIGHWRHWHQLPKES